MPKRIYVGNLPFSASDDEIREVFGKFGQVLAIDLGRGSATVEMADDASADRAIRALHQKEMGGRSLNVNEARPREGWLADPGRPGFRRPRCQLLWRRRSRSAPASMPGI